MPKPATVDVDHALGDRVIVCKLSEVGRVSAISIGFGGVMYQVAYYINGDRREHYFYGDELKPHVKAEDYRK